MDAVPHVTPADVVDGFTLVEATLAVGICAALAVGVTPVLLRATASAGNARERATATAAAVERIEQLRGLAWGVVDDGVGGHFDQTDDATRLDLAPATLTGTGLTASPPGSLLRDMEGWVDYLDEQGRWMSSGATAPVGARFVRRWNVAPLPSAPGDAIALQVLVTSAASERQLGARVDLTPRAGDVWLVAVRTREHYR